MPARKVPKKVSDAGRRLRNPRTPEKDESKYAKILRKAGSKKKGGGK